MARKKKKIDVQTNIEHRFDVNIEKALANRVVDNEFKTAETNNQLANDDYESYLDLLNCNRSEKKYDWLSNITIPEFTSLHLMGQGLTGTQNFSTRDYTEVYIGDSGTKENAEAEKRVINNTLNQRELYYYHKLMRANSAKDLDGVAYIRCWWEQGLKPGVVGTETIMEEDDVDIFGDPIIDRANQTPDVRFVESPLIGDVVEFDRFNFDILDRRDVFESNEYTYSIQENKFTIIRYSATIPWLITHREEMGYFNIEVLENTHIRGDETGKGTHTDDFNIPRGSESDRQPIKDWVIIERYGLDWVLIKTDAEGNETIEPGIDMNNDIVEGAELRNITSAFATSGTHRILIRFQEGKYIAATGQPYIPLIRWVCYVHPTRKEGMGDGKCSKELQIALDDTANVSNDRTMLSTMPTMAVRKDAIEDNDSIYWEPSHLMKLEDPVTDLRELRISDNISGAASMMGFYKAEMEQMQAINASPNASAPVTTATDIAAAEARTTIRNQFKQFSAEHTFYTEFYWMISQMTWQFAREETLVQRAGNRAKDFDPSLSYSYKPITSAIETEHGKRAKTQTYLQLGQINAAIENPKTPALLNFINARIFELQGAEYEEFRDFLLDESVPSGGEVGSVAGGQGALVPPSNEQGIDQSQIETNARAIA